MTLGEKILEQRKKIGFSQEELGNELNVTRQSVSLWETNQAQPALDNLISLTKLFNISMDELCGGTKIEKIESEKKEYLFKTSTAFNSRIYERAYNNFYKKWKISLTVVTIFSCFLLLTILTTNSHKALVIIPCTFLLIAFMSFIKIASSIKKLTRNGLSSKHNLITDFYFYSDHLEIESHSDNSNSNYSKKYNKFTRISQDDEFIFLEFDGVFSVIEKNNCKDNLNQVYQFLNIQQSFSKKTRAIKILLLVMFILSIVSIFLSLITIAITVACSPLPDFPMVMAEYMWIFFLYTPLPVSSLVLGVIFIKKDYKTLKNIIAGGIMTFFLCIYGSFTIMLKDQISHDYAYIESIAEKTNINIPKNGYAAIAYNNIEDCVAIAMVKFEENENSEFLKEIVQNVNWKSDVSYIPTNTIDLYSLTTTSSYEYFMVYNVTNGEYNDFFGSLIYMAYDTDTCIFYVAEYK